MATEKPQIARKRGRPTLPVNQKKKTVTLRLTPELVGKLDAAGKGWRKRIEIILSTMYP